MILPVATYTDIADVISHGRPFRSTAARTFAGERIAVLTGPARVTGPLASDVQRTAADYTEQYLTGGGRERPAWHVVYYVATISGHVIGYVTRAGNSAFDSSSPISPTARATMEAALQEFAAKVSADEVHEFTEYAMQDDDTTGVTFNLHERDSRTPIQEATITRTFTDRREAYEAMRAADDLKNHRHAWITRTKEN